MTTTLIRAQRAFKLGGTTRERGEVIDLSEIELPPGRADQLVRLRLAEYVTAVPDTPTTSVTSTTAGAAVTPVEPDGLSGLTNADLRARLKEAGLPTYGAKNDLIARLRAGLTEEPS